jgi:callose synthase
VYRIKLPGNPVLGEGKPENQNHSLIFSRGRYLQAIDMNQDGYFEESLKMRNLLQEFDSGCSILGFREHIFTGSVSSVANYMALQELSFVSLGQRVLSQPLKIRQHYGHPDLFDKFFVMTEGWLLFVLYIPFHLSCIWSKFVILIEQSY